MPFIATPDHFWSRVSKPSPDSCWPWTGGKDQDGYGLTEMAGTRYRAHRLAWKLENGSLPKGKVVRHACDNPPCCNPAHLVIGTQRDNMADMFARGRSKLVMGDIKNFHNIRVKGERHPASKLTEDEVRAIRSSASSQKHLAGIYGVSATTIHLIVHRKKWAYLA